MKCRAKFIYFACGFPFIPIPFVEKKTTSPYFVPLLGLDYMAYYCGSTFGSYIVFHFSTCLSFANPTLS